MIDSIIYQTLSQIVNLIENHGVEGDWKVGRNPKRQLNIMSGEQMVSSDVDFLILGKGSRLQSAGQSLQNEHSCQNGSK